MDAKGHSSVKERLEIDGNLVSDKSMKPDTLYVYQKILG